MVIDIINSKLNKTDWIVEGGKKYPITYSQLLVLQTLVKNKEIDANSFQLFDGNGYQLKIRKDGLLVDDSTSHKVVKDLVYGLM